MLVAMLALASNGLVSSPSGVLQQWRETRLSRLRDTLAQRFARDVVRRGRIDPSAKYHVNVLIVDGLDDGGARALICEELLESRTQSMEVARWVYPHCASLSGNANVEQQGAGALGANGALLTGLEETEGHFGPLNPERLRLHGPYDLVVCMDLEVVEGVKRLAPKESASILCMADFLALCTTSPAISIKTLQPLIAPQQAALATLVELPRVMQGVDSDEEWARYLDAVTLCVAGLTHCLKEVIQSAAHEHFIATLRACKKASELADPSDELTAALRKHALAGVVSTARSTELIEERRAKLRKDEEMYQPVDVSDLGLTMDDLTGPMGGDLSSLL